MPDSPPAPEAESPRSKPEPEADELAKGLPGLPLDVGGVRVSEDGFIQGEGLLHPTRFIPWAAVRGVSRGLFGIELFVLGDNESGRRRDMIVIHSTPSRLAALETAWWEFRTRALKRDGRLLGGAFPLRSVFDLATAIGGGLLVSLAVVVIIFVWGRTPGPMVFLRMPLALLAIWGLNGSLETVGHLVRKMWIERRWSKWRLDAAGISRKEVEGERTLRPGAGDSAGRGEVRVDGERVPVNAIHYGRVTAGVLLAMAARRGARLKTAPWSRWHTILAAKLVFIIGVTAFLVVMELGTRQMLDVVPVVALMFGTPFAALLAGSYLSARRELRRLLTRGRAMLERLGW